MNTSIPFDREHHVRYGELETLRPGLRRITANNPGPFTFKGTGTLLVGRGEVAVIDPGPADEAHVEALLHALGNEKVSHILVTHTHLDHSPGCVLLQQRTGAATYGYGPHGARRDASGDVKVADDAQASGDVAFKPDVTLDDNAVIEGGDWQLRAIHTPGHAHNHLCFAEDASKTLYSGDHVMAWSTSVVLPPDGNMTDYVASLRLLLERDDEIYWPAHGGPVHQPHQFVQQLIKHRLEREQQIINAVSDGCHDVAAMVAAVYAELDPKLYPAAAQSLYATLLHLVASGELQCDGDATIDAHYRLR